MPISAWDELAPFFLSYLNHLIGHFYWKRRNKKRVAAANLKLK
jgi:hypothetical protein